MLIFWNVIELCVYNLRFILTKIAIKRSIIILGEEAYRTYMVYDEMVEKKILNLIPPLTSGMAPNTKKIAAVAALSQAHYGDDRWNIGRLRL